MLLRLEDAGIIGAGHETLHQRFSLAINEEDLVERGCLLEVDLLEPYLPGSSFVYLPGFDDQE